MTRHPSEAHWETSAAGHLIGKSVEGREIRVRILPNRLGGCAGGVLLIGGLHGDELATVALLEDLLTRHELQWPHACAVAVLAAANPDGCARHSRYNARGVDLNRNCAHHWNPASVEPSGPAPWSEPEICALRDFIAQWEPRAIISLHWALSEIDADGAQSRELAQAMWQAMSPEERGPYRVRVAPSDDGVAALSDPYSACPGSLGQWCGYALRYADGSQPAMVTLELPYDPALRVRPEALPPEHLAEMHERWRSDPAGYLRAVEPGVHKMLLAACE